MKRQSRNLLWFHVTQDQPPGPLAAVWAWSIEQLHWSSRKGIRSSFRASHNSSGHVGIPAAGQGTGCVSIHYHLCERGVCLNKCKCLFSQVRNISKKIPEKLVMWVAFREEGLSDRLRGRRRTSLSFLLSLKFLAMWMYYLFKRTHLNSLKKKKNTQTWFLIKRSCRQRSFRCSLIITKTLSTKDCGGKGGHLIPSSLPRGQAAWKGHAVPRQRAC